jgi:hypothetical protein
VVDLGNVAHRDALDLARLKTIQEHGRVRSRFRDTEKEASLRTIDKRVKSNGKPSIIEDAQLNVELHLVVVVVTTLGKYEAGPLSYPT